MQLRDGLHFLLHVWKDTFLMRCGRKRVPPAEAAVPRRQEVTSGRQGFSEGSGRVAGLGLSQGG